MCGIVGYIGHREASSVLLNSLKKLEYRGYDSCGIAIRNGSLEVFKDKGSVDRLSQSLQPSDARIGIGHTRWATHGKPSQINAHPHTDSREKIAVVHNGIITNYQLLKDQLKKDGYIFVSETDTEIIPHLIRKHYHGGLEEAVLKVLPQIEGSYAFVALSDDSDCLVAAKNENPLIIGVGDGEWFLASDVPAILDYTNQIIYLEDNDVVVITRDRLKITNNGEEVIREQRHISWNAADTSQAGYAHFLLKEIHEQPRAIQNIFGQYLSQNKSTITTGLNIDPNELIVILACGSSYHAGLIGEHIIEEIAGIPVKVEIGSEFRHNGHIFNSKSSVIAITQSGESADTLRGLKQAKGLGNSTLAITNVLGSSVTRIADEVFYTMAGPEISVAATKTFTSQLVALYLLALSVAKIGLQTRLSMIEELRKIPMLIQQVLDNESAIATVGRYLGQYDNVFLIARGINLPVALEGALKLKEVSYIHAEGFPAGELKHGPFAVLSPNTPVVAIAARDNTYETLLTNIKEIKAREAPVIAISEEIDDEINNCVDFVIKVPKTIPILSPIANTVVMQLLAYYAALERGCPIDKPRNLAKSVTVE